MTKDEILQLGAKAIDACNSGYKDARKLLLAWFVSQVGKTEEPINVCEYNTWFYNKPVNGKPYAWCATFICYGHAFVKYPYPAMGWKKGFCSVPDYHKRMIYGQKITTDPKPFDDVIFDWEDDGADDHIGKFICWGDAERTWFYSIEGNTSFDEKGSQSRGGAVAFRKRSVKSVSAFISIEHLLVNKAA